MVNLKEIDNLIKPLRTERDSLILEKQTFRVTGPVAQQLLEIMDMFTAEEWGAYTQARRVLGYDGPYTDLR